MIDLWKIVMVCSGGCCGLCVWCSSLMYSYRNYMLSVDVMSVYIYVMLLMGYSSREYVIMVSV